MNFTNMTFRKMTFLFISLILILLFFLQLALIQNYSKDVSSKIGEAAFQVSRSTIEKLLFGQPNNQFKAFAFSSRISRVERDLMIKSISSISNDINISLNDGQKDKFISINSSGKNLLIDIPRTGITDSLDAMLNKLLVSSLAFIFFGILIANYFSKKLGLPLKELEKASQKIGKGEFGFQIKNNLSFQSIEIKNAVNAFNDMSEKIKTLQEENEKLQKQSQHFELAEITRGLAHTIRNPLNTLNLAIDELATTDDRKLSEKLSNISKKQIRRIDKWVRSMLDIMATDKNLTETVSIKELLSECIKESKQLQKNQTIIKLEVIDKRENRRFNLIANKIELKSLINGLISNAIESTSQTESKSNNDIKIILEKQGDLIKVSLLDQGKGFSEEIKSKLFSPHNTNKTYGAGMGLYLAQRVISLKYQGEIKVTNNPEVNNKLNPGAKIILTLNNRV